MSKKSPDRAAVKAGTPAGEPEVLARESRNEEIHSAAPRSAIEGEQVRPDRRRIKGSRFHKRDKLSGGWSFPFHVKNGSVLDSKKSECGAEAFPEHADAGAEFDGM